MAFSHEGGWSIDAYYKLILNNVIPCQRSQRQKTAYIIWAHLYVMFRLYHRDQKQIGNLQSLEGGIIRDKVCNDKNFTLW